MILASLCMRGGSKGVKNKNIIKLLGIPMFKYTLDAAKKSNLIDKIVISTDSDLIIKEAKKYLNDNLIFRRDKKLSKSDSSKWDVFRDLILNFEKKMNEKVEFLIDLDVTVPQKKTEHIEDIINIIKSNKYDCVVTGYVPDRNPYFNMMEKKNGYFKVCKESETSIVNRQNSPEVYSLSPSVFAFKRDAIFEYKHWSELDCFINLIPRKYGIDIDDEFDLFIVENILKNE